MAVPTAELNEKRSVGLTVNSLWTEAVWRQIQYKVFELGFHVL